MGAAPEKELYAWVEYLRDMGVYDLYRRDAPGIVLPDGVLERLRPDARAASSGAQSDPRSRSAAAAPAARPHAAPAAARIATGGASRAVPPTPIRGRLPEAPAREFFPLASASQTTPPGELDASPGAAALPPELAAPMPKPKPLEDLFPLPTAAVPPPEREAALEAIRAEIGDCTRCPLAYAGRHTIVFGEGDAKAELMFVGEGPGADEDTSGRPFVGKAGQLLNNMIGAMGLQREQVYIANIVKCRPPGNRAPEYAEATTCSQFLLRQIDVIRPKVIVALGSTAATYLLGVRQPLSALRGQWLSARGAKVAVTYHPAFLLRDPRQKAEAWKDLQRVMGELGLRPPAKA